MKQLQWGSTLLGVEITPEPGWIVGRDGAWAPLYECTIWGSQRMFTLPGDDDVSYSAEGLPAICRPVYPPRGWANATEAELWAEMLGNWEGEIASIGTRKGGFSVCVSAEGDVEIDGCTVFYMTPDHAHELPAAILALQNALQLSNRLKEGK